MNAPVVLVTGGAGFIGSHTCKALSNAGYRPVVFDDLSHGSLTAVKWGPFEQGDIRDENRIIDILTKYRVDAVFHFAGLISVAESEKNPLAYFDTNINGSLALMRAMQITGVSRLVFSSSAAVYGEPKVSPIPVDHTCNPISSYGRSKAVTEEIITDLGRCGNFNSICLRFFNASGADPDGELGENHDPETHLIPLALDAARGRRGTLNIYGTDHPTPDGTCIRDYVHVSDLANAHIMALSRLTEGMDDVRMVNIGTGRGYSVLEIIETVRKVTGKEVPLHECAPRPGDLPELIAGTGKDSEWLGWRPEILDLESMIRHADNWLSSFKDDVSAASS